MEFCFVPTKEMIVKGIFEFQYFSAGNSINLHYLKKKNKGVKHSLFRSAYRWEFTLKHEFGAVTFKQE